MQGSVKDYEMRWNQLSWEIDAVVQAFFAMTAFHTWSQELVDCLKQKKDVSASPFMATITVMANAIRTYFFISACRIREEKRSTFNLTQLFLAAKKLGLLKPEEQAIMKKFLSKTEKPFKIIKKARGMTIAHLQQPTSPFRILQDEGLSEHDILTYLQDCSEMFSLLGKPISQNHDSNILKVGKQVNSEVRKLLYSLCPLPQRAAD